MLDHKYLTAALFDNFFFFWVFSWFSDEDGAVVVDDNNEFRQYSLTYLLLHHPETLFFFHSLPTPCAITHPPPTTATTMTTFCQYLSCSIWAWHLISSSSSYWVLAPPCWLIRRNLLRHTPSRTWVFTLRYHPPGSKNKSSPGKLAALSAAVKSANLNFANKFQKMHVW